MAQPTLVLEPGPASATRLVRVLLAFLAELARSLDVELDDDGVHDIRKDLKRARATVRLLRPALGRSRFRAANLALRDAGRALAGRRDARVLVDTLRRLVVTEGLEPAALAPLTRRLRDDWQAAASAGSAPLAAMAAARIRAAAAEVRAARVRGEWPLLADGLRAVYRRGRRAMRVAARQPTAECLHEWRKQVKHGWHALELLERAWPKPMRALAREAHRLSDRLGDDHDLAVLRERLAAAAIDELARRRALAAIDARRRELQQSAFRLGERLYAESPTRFVARVGAWYQAGSERSG
jgi:CHAD domain-containing protein